MYFKINSSQTPALIVEEIIKAGVPNRVARVDIQIGSLYVNSHYICRVQQDNSIIRYCPPSELNKLIKAIE